ncbi:MAG TPA: hypothetical protein PLW07_06225, partial [bacterium]|nr:hypothetical protein [bacterium]
MVLAICWLCAISFSKEKFSASEEPAKNIGEVTKVDTSLFCFTIRDQEGTETKFFTSPMKIRMINPGENIQVGYKKTTDGQLKALNIKQVKEKKKGKKTEKQGKKHSSP